MSVVELKLRVSDLYRLTDDLNFEQQ